MSRAARDSEAVDVARDAGRAARLGGGTQVASRAVPRVAARFTPAEVHSGRHLELIAVRQKAVDGARMAHPERFVRGRPVARKVPGEVWINRPEQEPNNTLPQAAAS